jgi:hypothetical protein
MVVADILKHVTANFLHSVCGGDGLFVGFIAILAADMS